MSGEGASAQERWDARYARERGFDCRDPREIVVRAARLHPPGVALDLACGRGRNAVYLADLGWQVTAVDVSPVGLESIAHPRVSTVRADLEAGEFPIERESFDLIVDTFYLQRDLFAPIQSGLRPGGLFVAELPMQDAQAAPMNPDYLVETGELARLFGGWKIEVYEEVRVREHERMTARLIARKSA